MAPHPGRRRVRPLLATLGVLGILATTVLPAAAEETAFSFAGAGMTNPVGMTTDPGHQRYWAIRSTSGRLSVQAFDAEGAKQGAATSRDSATSVQGLAFVDGQLFIGDVGGNRSQVTVYQMDTPVPGTEILRALAMPLGYPDGAHDAAAIMVNASQKVFVVTRGRGAAIYAAPDNPSITYPNGKAAAVNKLAKVADAPAADVTDATFLIDGRIALRSASAGVIVLDPTSYAQLGTQEIAATQKGQALTQSLAPNALLAASGSDGSVVSVPIPGPAPAKPVATSTKKPDAPPPTDEPNTDKTFAQTGTTIALVAAMGVALLAAAVVLLKR